VGATGSQVVTTCTHIHARPCRYATCVHVVMFAFSMQTRAWGASWGKHMQAATNSGLARPSKHTLDVEQVRGVHAAVCAMSAGHCRCEIGAGEHSEATGTFPHQGVATGTFNVASSISLPSTQNSSTGSVQLRWCRKTRSSTTACGK
jgi:hypothetical protein